MSRPPKRRTLSLRPGPPPEERREGFPPMFEQIEGSKAMARTIALCRPQVVCAYPITPQTHIVEGVGELIRLGRLDNCEFINVESEFAALSVAIGASAAGARAYTATASQGLLFMAEAVYNAAGLGLPIVMTLGNRAIGAPINIWNDHSDAMALREFGLDPAVRRNRTRKRPTSTSSPSASPRNCRSRRWSASTASSSPTPSSASTYPIRRPSTPIFRPTNRCRASTPPIRSRSARWSGRTPSPKCATCNISSSTPRSA